MITVASFGGGTDSTAMLIGMVQKQLPVDLILFADTGGEKPHTYEHIKKFSEWLVLMGYPPIVSVRYKRETLEENSLRIKGLPSIAYGFKKCSLKFKVQPQDQYCNNWKPAKDAWKRGEKVTKLIGYEAGEERRAKISEDKKYAYRYPLIEWGWDRAKCIEVIQSVGLPLPGKSACFFCPSSKAQEVKQLAKDYPHLAQRALAMEANADLTTIKGLGRNYSWKDLLAFDEAQTKLFDSDYSTTEIPCGCYDGI
jgi:hypothetical protein